MKKIAIIGGGISGIFSAYFLHKQGHKVNVFESSKIGVECSYGNAGLLVPSHFETLSNPTVLKKGLKWMLNPNSPFFLKPRLDLDLIKWIIKFNSFCTQKHVDKNKQFIKDMSFYSKSLYEDLKNSSDFKFQLEHCGLLMMCKEEKTLKAEELLSKEAIDLGLDVKILNQKDLKKLEPNASFNVIGASFYKDDSKVQPYDLIMSIKSFLEKEGVQFYENCKITDLNINKNNIKSIITEEKKEYFADEFVFTSGVFTSNIAKKFDLNIPMQGGKGFSFKIDKNEALNFSTPMILAEEKVAVTPYDSYTRFAGTMMICGNDTSIVKRRVNNIRKAANSYINGLDIQENELKDVWAGLRPCSPDGLPYIGRTKNLNNVVIAAGHAMLGVSLGPATGKLVSDLINDEKSLLDISRLNLNRF